MKILFVVDNYSGGAGNIIQLLATEYAKTDEVSVLLTHKTAEKRYPCPGVKFVELTPEEKGAGVRAFLYQVKWVKQQIKEEKPDVIISFITLNGVLVYLAQPRKKIPHIACERINPLGRKEKFPWNLLTRLAYNNAEILTVQFEEFAQMYGGRYAEKCRVTPNYIATPEKTKDLTQKGEVTKFVSCGRLNVSKQFPLLLEMFAKIHRQEPKTELRIYGQGPYKNLMRDKIKALELEDCAFLMGYVNGTYDALLESDVYLMSSSNEGFPNALSEAMAVGLPCVAFRCNSGIDVLADYGRRYAVIDPNDREGFINACVDLCHNEEKRKEYSKNAKEVCQVYSMENVKKTWDACIAEAFQRSKK